MTDDEDTAQPRVTVQARSSTSDMNDVDAKVTVVWNPGDSVEDVDRIAKERFEEAVDEVTPDDSDDADSPGVQ